MAIGEYLTDALHGPIGITHKEREVIHTRVFQRLKNIKQLGTANFVYPCANHTRFEHSIGTMHITSLILDRLQKCDEAEKQTIRLAALLHDIGHGPFSHTFEEILRRNQEWSSSFQFDKIAGKSEEGKHTALNNMKH